MSNFSIVPNAAKTIESLRHLTYTNVSALADITDNSLDAGATDIEIAIMDDLIGIFDNGKGMSLQTMMEAIKLGSNTDKEQSELGRFGMGLVTAGISIAKRIELLSKQDGGQVHKVVLDLDEIAKTNEWIAVEGKVDIKDEVLFENFDSGTIVFLKKADNVIKGLESRVVKEFGRIFRKFIDSGVIIKVNESFVEASDPLELSNDKTEVMLDETIEYNGQNLNIKIVMLDNGLSEVGTRNLGRNTRNQGFYIVRNNREIDAANMLEMVAKHPQYNRMRGEISYSSDLDNAFGINFTKNKIVPEQGLLDKIRASAMPCFKLISNRSKKDKQVEDSKNIDHSDAEANISKKQQLLKSVAARKESRRGGKRSQSTEDKKEQKPSEGERKFNKFKEIKRPIPAKFKEVDLGVNGDLFEYDFEGKTLVIGWNIRHPFHENMIAKYSSDKDITSPLDWLIYSIVQAELTMDSDEAVAIIEQINSTLSSNLRTLMR